MSTPITDLINKAYTAFNNRDINAALALMTTNVHWPNGWEGGYVEGHDGVRDYWTRQWKEIDPHVEPVAIKERPDRKAEVTVKQTVKDLSGALVFDGLVKHIYTFEDNLVKNMEIEK